MSAEIADMTKRMANLMKVGKVLEVDIAAAKMKVQFGPASRPNQTAWLPWMTNRAGAGVKPWSAPEVGEQVVILCPGGDPNCGIVLRGGIYQQSAAAPSAEEGTYEIHIPPTGKFRVVCGAIALEFSAAGLNITGADVLADGIALKGHTHGHGGENGTTTIPGGTWSPPPP